MSAGSAARTSHDLRTALNIVMGNAELLQQSSPLTANQQRYAERILEASRQMLTILDAPPFKMERH